MELYYTPLACSLAARFVAAEAELPLTLHLVDVFAGTLATGGAYREVARFGQVPALRLDDGGLLTEVAAVLQYLADQRPARGLAPPAGSAARYRLIEWLGFVGTELHKKVLWPLFNRGVPEPVRGFARASAIAPLDHVEHHLAGRAHLVGDAFTAADAYLTWALHLASLAGLEPGRDRPALAAYLDRQRARPIVAALLAEETAAVRAAKLTPGTKL